MGHGHGHGYGHDHGHGHGHGHGYGHDHHGGHKKHKGHKKGHHHGHHHISGHVYQTHPQFGSGWYSELHSKTSCTLKCNHGFVSNTGHYNYNCDPTTFPSWSPHRQPP